MANNQKLQESFHNLLKSVIEQTKFETNVGEWAKVVRYDATKHVADVQPLISDDNGQDDGRIINECPVLYSAYGVDLLRKEIISKAKDAMKSIDLHPTMKVGATVYIVFNNRDMDNFTGKEFTKSTERMHDINDAVVIGVLEN